MLASKLFGWHEVNVELGKLVVLSRKLLFRCGKAGSNMRGELYRLSINKGNTKKCRVNKVEHKGRALQAEHQQE